MLPLGIFATSAIVLRTFPFGDTSRIAVLLTRDRGKVRVLAKGARGPKSRVGAALEPFAVIEAVYYDKSGRDLQLLKSAETVALHPGLTDTPSRLAFASAALELCDLSLTGEEAGPEFFDHLAAVLGQLEGAGRDQVGLFFGAYELRIAALLGYEAQLAACRGCGGPVDQPGASFSTAEGALICAACAGGRDGLERVEPRVAGWLQYLNGDREHEPEMPGGDRSELRDAARLIQLFLAAHLHNFRGLKSLGVLKRLEALEETGS